MSQHELRPLKQVHEISKVYSGGWKWVEYFIQNRGKELQDWPKNVFLPMGGWYAILCACNCVDELTDDMLGDLWTIAAIGAWRYTQGVYRLDPDFYAEIADTDLKGDMPVEVLFRLPEWCIYVETPDCRVNGNLLHGFYAHLEHEVDTQRWKFHFLMDFEDGHEVYVIQMGPWTILEGFERAIEEANRQNVHKGDARIYLSVSDRHSIAEFLKPFLSMVLYLCRDEPEIEGPLPGRPSFPKPKNTRKGWRLFAPNRPTIWKVGGATGQRLRTARAGSSERSEGKSPRAHVRRAHWHGYWVGPKDNREFQYRWLPPIFVSGEADPDPTKKAA
jgi:hypothetical protein